MEKSMISHSPLFLLRLVNKQTNTRVSAVVPNKTSKNSVDRNHLRRKIYEAVRAMSGLNGTNLASGVHAIIFAKPATLKATQVEIVADLKTLFVKVGILM